MGLFNFGKKKKVKNATVEQEQFDHSQMFEHDEQARRWYEARADKQYQEDLNKYYEFYNKINERYTVISNVGSFLDEPANILISECIEAFKLNLKIREKREYYEQAKFDQAPEMKTLSMVYEKRGEYDQAALVCAMAVDSGFPADGTAGGMRGRLARMIKKGNLELTDQFKKTLEL